ncbi:MAG: leucine-rich repeat protein [Oscillospiraceae bacterium]|nr:leucine-rich repeat protein [Oscillospiraceae bacterium]
MGDKMNKNRKLMHDLSGVSDKFITESAPKKRAVNIRMPWVYVGGAATAAAVLIMLGANLPERSDSEIFAPAATDATSVTQSIVTTDAAAEKAETLKTEAAAEKVIVTVPVTGNVSDILQSVTTEAVSAAETSKQNTEAQKQQENKPAETEKKPEVTEKAETTASTEYEHMEDIDAPCITSVTKNPDGSIRLIIRDGQFAVTLPASWNNHFVIWGAEYNDYENLPEELAWIDIKSKLANQTEDYYDAIVYDLSVSAIPAKADTQLHYDTVGYSRGEYLRSHPNIAVDRFSCSEEAYQENLALLDTRDQIIIESYNEETGKFERQFSVPEYPYEAESGDCSLTTKWSYDKETKTLTISAKSDDETDWMMRSQGYAVMHAPWKEMSWYNEIENVVVKKGVAIIGIDAFTNCTSLKSFTAEDDNIYSFMAATFQNCKYLTSITLSKNAEYIYNDTFEGCTNLKEVIIPGDQLTEIQHGAFKDCTSLEVLELPESVTTISDYAFRGCSENLVLKCKEGSYVQQYAEAHGMKFEAVAE